MCQYSILSYFLMALGSVSILIVVLKVFLAIIDFVLKVEKIRRRLESTDEVFDQLDSLVRYDLIGRIKKLEDAEVSKKQKIKK